MLLTSFDHISPLSCADGCTESRVLQVERVELTRSETAELNRPAFFESLLEIDHFAEVPILTKFDPSPTAKHILPHLGTKFIVSQPKVLDPSRGWSPDNFHLEPIVHTWDPLYRSSGIS